MKYINLIIKLLGNIRSILVLIILTRLLFIETNQMALFAEIVASGAVLLNPLTVDAIDE